MSGAQFSRQLPGRDGCKAARRFMPVAFKSLPPGRQRVAQIVLQACMHAIHVKHSSPAATEPVVEAALDAKYHDYTSIGASKIQRESAPYIPRTFKQALTILSHYSACVWPTLCRYDLCPCGFLYRKEHAQATSCPAVQSHNSKPCQRVRALAARSLLYSPLSDFIRRVYANRRQAQEFATWQDRMSNSGVMMDIADGAYVRHILDTDQRFKEEPRNLLFLLVTDPFIVSNVGEGLLGDAAALW